MRRQSARWDGSVVTAGSPGVPVEDGGRPAEGGRLLRVLRWCAVAAVGLSVLYGAGSMASPVVNRRWHGPRTCVVQSAKVSHQSHSSSIRVETEDCGPVILYGSGQAGVSDEDLVARLNAGTGRVAVFQVGRLQVGGGAVEAISFEGFVR